MLDRDFLARFLSCDVPPDVRRWVIALAHGAMTPRERREERDRWFRAAGALLANDEPWTRARRLHLIALDVRREIPAAPDVNTARGCVAAALLACPTRRPPSVHTLYRLIESV